jgi:hypothetical protein
MIWLALFSMLWAFAWRGTDMAAFNLIAALGFNQLRKDWLAMSDLGSVPCDCEAKEKP